MSIQTVRLCDRCGDLMDMGACDTVRLVYTSGKTLTADLCGICFEQMLHGDIRWEDVKEEVVVPLPEPEKTEEPEPIPEEPTANPPSEEEGEEFGEDETFDSIDDAVMAFLSSTGSASVTQIAEAVGAAKHETVCTLERLRRKGMTAKAQGRYMWRALA